MMTGSIVCGVDDSDSAREAARVARMLAAGLGLGLTFVRVVEPEAPDAEVSAIAERLERLSAGATDVDCGAGWLVEAGRPADRLVAAAVEAEAALVVVGFSGERTALTGSVSEEVARRAPCPVVVVPPRREARRNGHDGRPGERERAGAGTAETHGLVRFALGGGGAESSGGIVRFGVGSSAGGG